LLHNQLTAGWHIFTWDGGGHAEWRLPCQTENPTNCKNQENVAVEVIWRGLMFEKEKTICLIRFRIT